MKLRERNETTQFSWQLGSRASLRSFFSEKSNRYLAIILVFYLFFSFFMITKFPRVWMDESWCAMEASTLATEGKLANPILRGRGDGLDQHTLWPIISHNVLLAAIYKISGFGLVQSRALSIFVGFFLILATYFFAKKHFDGAVAILAIILLVSDNVFFVTSRTVRPDIFLALFASTAFFLFLHGLETTSLKFFAFSGILIGISLYTHPNSFLVLVAILIIFMHKYRLSIIRSKPFWIFSLFCLIAFSPYAIYLIKEDYANNFSHFMSQVGGRAGFLEGRFLQTYLVEYTRYANYIYFPRRMLIFLVQIGALVYAVSSKRRLDKYLLLFVFVFVGLLPEWNQGNRTPRYFIVFIPALSILVSKLFIDIYGKASLCKLRTLKLKKRIGYTIAGVIIFLFFVNQIGGDIYILWKHKNNNYYSLIAKIKDTIPKHARTWGEMSFWMGLHDYQYLTHSSPPDEIEEFKPEYAIMYDSGLWGLLSSTVRRKTKGVLYKDVKRKMEELCRKRGVLVRRIMDPHYGNLEIYKINWEM